MNSKENDDVFRDAISTSDIEKVKLLLSVDKSLINSQDKEGLSPLQFACFRGALPVVEFLLKCGANVNSTSHKQGYTALMFAALSGNTEVVELLLHHGARVNDVNSIGRTASQMAAFVGNHNVVTLINNYMEREEISIYTSKHNLPCEYVPMLHRLILQLNISPVKVFLLFNDENDIHHQAEENNMLAHWRFIRTIFEDLCNKYFTPHLTHEPLALKLHLLACCVRQAGEHYDKGLKSAANQDRTSPPLKQLIKKFLTGTDPYGLPAGQEQFLRQSVTSFPHHQSTLWRHVVQQISPLVVGGIPTAFSILTKAVNGSIMYNARPFELCATCGDGPELGKPEKLRTCQQCKIISYCSVSCQRLHWFTHKKYCPILKEHKNEFEVTK